MNLTIEVVYIILAISLVAGVFATRNIVASKRRNQLAERLNSIVGNADETVALSEAAPPLLMREGNGEQRFWGSIGRPGSLSLHYRLFKRAKLKRQFTEQLPDAIDMMISVLRSGHSVPQAVRIVGAEMANPCGAEFSEVLQRMNLGQPLAEALAYSVDKFDSYELDLIRRAVAIQAEVGGSLAELLGRTNQSLRQRIKLVRHVRVLTAQSRLTAIIVGVMPFILAVALEFLNPGYLRPLFETEQGKLFIFVAIILQFTGLMLMRKLSTVKI